MLEFENNIDVSGAGFDNMQSNKQPYKEGAYVTFYYSHGFRCFQSLLLARFGNFPCSNFTHFCEARVQHAKIKTEFIVPK